MRLFIGVFLPKTMASELKGYFATQAVARYRWLPEQSYHVTMRFLGETDHQLVPKLEEAIQLTAEAYPSFQMTLKGGGVFPRVKKPQVFWAGIEDGADHLTNLYDRLNQRLVGLNLPKDNRPFVPHISIAKLQNGVTPNISDSENFMSVVSSLTLPHVPVTQISLVRSRTKSTGPEYEQISSFSLAA